MNDENTILLVEDIPDDKGLTSLAFEQGGCSSHPDIVRDGAEAFDRLFATGNWGDWAEGLPQAVLLDLNRPRISGLDVRRLRAEPSTRLIPVVIHSSSTGEQEPIRSCDPARNHSIQKQVSFSRFAAAFRKPVHRRMLVNESPGLGRAA